METGRIAELTQLEMIAPTQRYISALRLYILHGDHHPQPLSEVVSQLQAAIRGSLVLTTEGSDTDQYSTEAQSGHPLSTFHFTKKQEKTVVHDEDDS